MKINRHPVELELMEQWFHRDSQRLDDYLQYARQRVQSLSRFHDFVAENVYRAGSAVAPDSTEVARALRLSAQALAAVFAFRIEPTPEAYELGEGPPVRYPTPIDPSIPDILIWRKAYHLALIARQAVPLGYLCRVTKDTFRGSSLVGPLDQEYRLKELKQQVWLDSTFAWEPLLIQAEKVVARSVEISNPAGAETAQYLSVPYYRVLRKLGEHDAAGLEAALTNALALHKEYWSATEDRRKEKAGFVSLPLIALAALAWDRGLRFHVESDYLPWSWVTGEIFTPRFADASK